LENFWKEKIEDIMQKKDISAKMATNFGKNKNAIERTYNNI